MSKTFTDVEVFLHACGQKHSNTPVPQNDLSKLYLKLIHEEYEEFREALAEDDDAEQLDACFDMMWVIIGYMKSRGWDCEAAWDEGAKSFTKSRLPSKTNPAPFRKSSTSDSTFGR